MAKRRTRTQKIKAKHKLVSHTVKRENKIVPKKSKKPLQREKSAVKSVKVTSIEPQARGMLKSLILASLILGLEVVIYLFWPF